MAGSASTSNTPVAKREAGAHLLDPGPSTPLSRFGSVSVNASFKRVHFSPQNEEFHVDMVPQSSPTSARRRPFSRSILKRSIEKAASSQQLLSSDIDGCDQYSENGLLDRFPSPTDIDAGMPQSMANQDEDAARVLFASTEAGVNRTGANSNKNTPFDQVFTEAVEKLHEIVSEDSQSAVQLTSLYSELSSAISKNNDETANTNSYSKHMPLLLDCLRRDISIGRKKLRVASLAALKCLACVLHADKLSGVVENEDKVFSVLQTMFSRVQDEHPANKALGMIAVSCIGVQRVSAATFQRLIPDSVKLCVHIMSQFERSTSLVFQCLVAIEMLLKRFPSATRDEAHLWLFPVLGHIASPISGVQAKADDIIRRNMPWVAADAQRPDMDVLVHAFIDKYIDLFFDSWRRLCDQDEFVLIARTWGMVVTVCARWCRPRIGDLLQVIQTCFNSKNADILVAALMQWRCLIYAFTLENRIQLRKCVKLVVTPISALLSNHDNEEKVRLASVRCWAMLVYALGEELGSHIDIVMDIAFIAAEDPSTEVRETVARILAATLNRNILPEDKIAQFVIPKMIIGTTTLAAADGKGLSATRGPFSSESDFSGDHTVTTCGYIIGIGKGSPTVPVITQTISKFIQRYVIVECAKPGLSNAEKRNQPESRSKYEEFSQLCGAFACVANSSDVSLLAELLLNANPLKQGDSIYSTIQDLDHFLLSPYAVLFQVLSTRFEEMLTDVSYDFMPDIWGFERAGACVSQAISATFLVLLFDKLCTQSSTLSDQNQQLVLNYIDECTSKLVHSTSPDQVVNEGCILFLAVLECLLHRYPVSNMQKQFIEDMPNAVLQQIKKHALTSLSFEEHSLSLGKLFGCVLRIHALLPDSTRQAQLDVIVVCREAKSNNDFWSTVLSLAASLLEDTNAVKNWHTVDMFFALCQDKQVDTDDPIEILHCYGLGIFLLGLVIKFAVGDTWTIPALPTLNASSPLPASPDRVMVEQHHITTAELLAVTSHIKKLGDLDVEQIIRVQRIITGLIDILCYTVDNEPPNNSSLKQHPVLISSDMRSADTTIAGAKDRLNTCSSELQGLISLAINLLSFLEQLRQHRIDERSTDYLVDMVEAQLRRKTPKEPEEQTKQGEQEKQLEYMEQLEHVEQTVRMEQEVQIEYEKQEEKQQQSPYIQCMELESTDTTALLKRQLDSAATSDNEGDKGTAFASLSSTSSALSSPGASTIKSRRKDRAKRARLAKRRRLAANSDDDIKGLEQLMQLLGRLEAGLEDTSRLSIDNVCVVQERISSIQQRLCRVVRQKVDELSTKEQ
ncbi:Rap1-interacting factor 1 N terminal-domain-containing protein [Coemansia spiralis]|nr:Rap1-interacting factor 1 N terminal-domain-containing protein [Coemansia spiralis]